MIEKSRIPLRIITDRNRFARLGRQARALERREQLVPNRLMEEQRQLDQRLTKRAPRWWRPHFETNRPRTSSHVVFRAINK